MPVRIICIFSFAVRICIVVTGNDFTSHSVFPSSETDGAAVSFTAAARQITAHMITAAAPAEAGSAEAAPPVNIELITSTTAPPLISSTTPSTISRMLPMPQFRI